MCRRWAPGRSILSRMALALNQPLLDPGARKADEKDLRRLLEKVRYDPPAEIQREIDARFIPDSDRHRRATYLLNLALTQWRTDGKIPWLFGDTSTDKAEPPDGIVEAPPAYTATSEGEAVFGEAMKLPTDELLLVAQALLSAVAARQEREMQDKLAARQESLEQLAQLTQLMADTKQRVDLTVIHAKRNGASWAEIGRACGVRRDVAHKRWASLVIEASSETEDDDPPTPSFLIERP